ncbi:MAG: DNA alkylation repair protein [candidate division SR1 bacterium]|nr:DNA alkylation repair protein [candidate division SR1 bacterium]
MTIFSDLHSYANPEQAKNLQRFFKTGEGDYGEGDIFLGLKVPEVRIVAKKHIDLDFATLQILLDSKIHEYRMVALLILVLRNKKADPLMKDQIFNFYIKNTRNINNWDLVDLTAPGIMGNYLLERDKKLLYTFARSKHLREKRIAIISTFAFLKVGDYEDCFKIAEILLTDTHDLIHKAVGWMLREVGKRSLFEEETFLKKHYKTMPRTMLRYAIEKFEESRRQAYLKGLI